MLGFYISIIAVGVVGIGAIVYSYVTTWLCPGCAHTARRGHACGFCSITRKHVPALDQILKRRGL